MLAIAAIIAIVVVISVLAVGFSGIVPGFRLSGLGLQPGFEGLQLGIYGFSQAANTPVIPLGTNLTAPFAWGSNTPYAASISAYDTTISNNPFLGSNNEFNIQKGTVQIQTSVTSTDTDHPIEEISYYIYNGTANGIATYTHVVGELVCAYVDVNIWVTPHSGEYKWNYEQIWLEAQTNVWNQAIIDPSNPGATAFAAESIPIAAVIQSYKINNYVDDKGTVIETIPEWVSSAAQISPQNQGGVLQLYTTPGTAGVSTITYLNPTQITADELNASVAGSVAPDSRFSPVVYTPITLEGFGGNDNAMGYLQYIIGQAQFGYPSVTLKVQVYYLLMGSFLLQVNNTINSTLPVFHSQNTTISTSFWQDIANSLGSWWSNPLNQVELFITLIIAAIVVVVIFLVFTNIGRAADKIGGHALSKKGGK